MSDDQIELDDWESILNSRLTAKKKVQIPEWIHDNTVLYGEIVQILGVSGEDRTKLVQHHKKLADSMAELADALEQAKPKYLTLPSTREASEDMAEDGIERLKTLAHTICSQLKLIIATLKSVESKQKNNEPYQEDIEQAQKMLKSLGEAKDYQKELREIKGAYYKINNQADKERLAILKFAVKVMGALLGAYIFVAPVVSAAVESLKHKTDPSQPQQSG
jgi:ABC-type Fe3+-citrate transport system substrate-binding protein